MRTRDAAASLALALTVIGKGADAVHAQATIGGEWRKDVAAYAARVVEAGLTPGMSVAVTVGDWVVYSAGFGLADMASGRPVLPETPFYIASSTKSLTGLAAALAAAEGKLDFTQPMVRYLPRARLADGVARESITVHDLAALTHGLAGGGPVVMRTAYTGDFTEDQLLELLRFHAPSGQHGEYNYNNLGYNLLGMVLESVYPGQSWKDVVQRLVLDPLGMQHSSAWVSRLGEEAVALPHDELPEGFVRIPLAKADANMHAAGGHFASAPDLARYLAAHLTGGIVEGKRVLPEAPILLTHRQQVAQDRTFGPYHRHGWGYGWDLGTYEGDTLVHRFGGFEGYRSHMSFMPARGLGVVVLTNGAGTASAVTDLVATYIYDRLLAKPGADARAEERLNQLRGQMARQREGTAQHLAERRARLQPLRQPLAMFAGAYESPQLGRMEIREVAGGLELRLGVVASRGEVYDASKDQLRFEVGGGGVVATFVFPQGGGPAGAVQVAGTEFNRVAR